MSKPKVSVIVPVYNVEKYLRQCLNSVLSQTLRELEIIVVNDGSKDNCPAIIDEYAAKDSRVVAIHQPNGGYGVAVNHGIAAATGEYVGIIESDDWIEPTMYKKLYDNACRNNSDVVKCSFYKYDSTKENLEKQNRKWKTKYMDLFDAPNVVFRLEDFPQITLFHASVWASIYRSEFIKNIRMIETGKTMYQDFPFMCTVMSAAKRISVEKDYLIHYRIEPEQNSSTNQKGEKLIQMATRCIDGIEILRTNNALDWVREEIYHHAFTANIGFFNKIVKEFKRAYFDELHRLFAPLANDKNFTFKYFSRSQKEFCKAIIKNDFEKAIRLLSKIEKMSLLEHVFSLKNRGDHKVITICGVKIKINRKNTEGD